MSSVQELLALAEAKNDRSGAASSAAQFLSGYQGARDKGLDRVMKLIQIDQARTEMAAQAEMQKAMAAQVAQAQDEATKRRLNSATVNPAAVMPQIKMKEKIIQNEKGLYSRSFETDSGKDVTYQHVEYQDESGRGRIGRFNTSTGAMERMPNDPYSTKKPTIDLQLSEAEKVTDKKFAEDYTDFVLGGGSSSVQKDLGQLNTVIAKLEKGGGTDSFAGMKFQPSGKGGLISKEWRDIILPEGANIQDLVGGVVQKNLRKILGGQFAQMEGAQLVERAYNPRQPPEKNIARLKALMQELQDAAKARIEASQYYEEHGTLKGFKGKLYQSAADFAFDADAAAPGSGDWTDTDEQRYQELLKKSQGK